MQLDRWATDLAEQLSTSGVPVVWDPHDLAVPGALLSVKTIYPDRLARGVWTVVWSLAVVGSGHGIPEAYRTLGAAMTRLETVTEPDEDGYTAEQLVLPDGARLPAFIFQIITECKDD